MFTGLAVQISHPRRRRRGSPLPRRPAVVRKRPLFMSLSVATLRTTCTHSLLHSSYDPADPALPHPLIYRSPSPLPPIPFPRWSRKSPASPCPGLSILSRRTAYGVTHKLRLPLQTPTECCHKGPTRPVSETETQHCARKERCRHLIMLEERMYATLSSFLQGWKTQLPFVQYTQLVIVPPQSVDLPPPPPTFALP